MAEKKWQHYVPQVYLKSFTDIHPPSGWPAERPFEPVVWIAQSRALDSFRRKAPVNILASTRLRESLEPFARPEDVVAILERVRGILYASSTGAG